MWKRADEVPAEFANEILDRFDQTEPKLQRMITLQFAIDMMNAKETAGDLMNKIRIANLLITQFGGLSGMISSLFYVIQCGVLSRPIERGKSVMIDEALHILAKENSEGKAPKPPIPPA